MKKYIYLIIFFLILIPVVATVQQQLSNQSSPEKPPVQVEQNNPAVLPTNSPTKSLTACNGQLTPELPEGPYFTIGSPEKTIFYEEGFPGEKVTLTGYVFDTTCAPIANAWLDFWQSDGAGNYDLYEYTLRGYQHTNEEGKYFLETVIPGEYEDRTPHIHVKVRASDNSPIITTQLFFPNEARNSNDIYYNEALEAIIQETPNGKTATFNFVIQK